MGGDMLQRAPLVSTQAKSLLSGHRQGTLTGRGSRHWARTNRIHLLLQTVGRSGLWFSPAQGPQSPHAKPGVHWKGQETHDPTLPAADSLPASVLIGPPQQENQRDCQSADNGWIDSCQVD